MTGAKAVAVTGAGRTGGASAGGRCIARREPLPMDKTPKPNRRDPAGDIAPIERCIYFPHRTAGAVA